jgi:hypothetical protein
LTKDPVDGFETTSDDAVEDVMVKRIQRVQGKRHGGAADVFSATGESEGLS